MLKKEELLLAVGAGNDVPETLAEAREKIRSGELKIGEIVLIKNGVPWRLVDLPEGRAVIMTAVAFDYAPFSRPDKRYPWGWNNYMASQIRNELNTVYPEQLLGEEKEQLLGHDGERGVMWLLDLEEAGFVQGDGTYKYFRDEDPDVPELKRQLIDLDGDSTFWWLRSPNPSNANYERFVTTDGSLGSSLAYNGYGAVAACEIEL
jgi:hypothetical protein